MWVIESGDMKPLTLKLLPGSYCVHQLAPQSSIPEGIFTEKFFSVTQNEEELSVVCDSRLKIDSEKTEADFLCLQIVGLLDFAMTGILAEVASILSRAGISIFAISTYNTDAILFKSEHLDLVKRCLQKAGHSITGTT